MERKILRGSNRLTAGSQSYGYGIGNLIDAILHFPAGVVVEDNILSIGTSHLRKNKMCGKVSAGL